tara:strand:- start:222 stop:1412 length:1191 start_codon:yes stop_codon:yes gene_type:complete
MAIGSRICGNFYVKTGGGTDEITSKRLNELDTAFNADKSKGSGQLIYDDQLGPLVFNLQDVVADIDQIRSYISPLPVNSGGTGTTSTTFCSLTANVSGTLPVGNGGTGATTLTSNAILIGNGTSVITANAKLTYDTDKLELGADADNTQTIKRVDHSDDDGGELHIKAGAGGGLDKDGGDLVLYPGAHTSNGTPGRIILKAGEKGGSSGSTPQGLGDIAFVDGDSVSNGGSFDLKAGVFRGGNIGSTQMDASGDVYIPITATEWLQPFTQAKKGSVDGISGYDRISVNKVGYAPWYTSTPLSAYCEKVIPRGYAATAAIVYGSNAGGVGTESKFAVYETSLISNTETSRLSGTNWGSSGTFGTTVVGDGNKCVTVGIELNDKNDIIYGGKIFITKI